MPILRTIRCDVCGEEEKEKQPDAGFPGWGELRGIALDGAENPTLCPEDLGVAAAFIDRRKRKYAQGGE